MFEKKTGKNKYWNMHVSIIDKKTYNENKKIIAYEVKMEYININIEQIYGLYWTTWNEENGKITKSENTIIKEGVHIGQINETSILKQTISCARTIMDAKIKKGHQFLSEDDKKSYDDFMQNIFGINKKIVEQNNEMIFAMTLHRYDKFKKRVNFPAWITEKLNGDRVLVDIDPLSKKVNIYSRLKISYSGINFIEFESNYLINYIDRRIILDCEAFDKNKRLNEITGLIKNSNNIYTTYLNCFDMYIPLEPNEEFKNRYMNLMTLFKNIYHKIKREISDNTISELKNKYKLFDLSENQFGHFKYVNYCVVNNHNDIEFFFNKFKQDSKDNFEGAVIRNLNGKYELGSGNIRSYNALKYKEIYDAEFIITGFENGGKGKCNGTIKFICLTSKGVTFRSQIKEWDTKKKKEEYEKCLTINSYFNDNYANKYAKIQYSEIYDNGVPQQPYIISIRSSDDIIMDDDTIVDISMLEDSMDL
jgi:ATP-dependent DNA ligase